MTDNDCGGPGIDVDSGYDGERRPCEVTGVRPCMCDVCEPGYSDEDRRAEAAERVLSDGRVANLVLNCTVAQ